MKLIKQSYELLGTPQSLEESWSFVARAARNCYQSEKTRLDESEEDFCKRILLKHPEDLEKDHMSPFEFGIIYLKMPSENGNHYYYDKYSRYFLFIDSNKKSWYYVTTNLRVILENHWEDDLKYAGPPTKYHMKACCFKMITNRAIMAEITRHRTLSFCIESTRYCNYSKDKFGNKLTFIQPCWALEHDTPDTWEDCSPAFAALYQQLINVEACYNNLIREDWTPQQAATILPNALKTTIMMCGYEDNLQHMFRLRAEECSGPVHPQMGEIMKPMYNDYKKWISNELL